MKRPDFPLTLGLAISAAVFAASAVVAGEAGPPLSPGLEIFDGAAPRSDGGQSEAAREDFLSDPVMTPPVAQPPYQAPEVGASRISRPYQRPQERRDAESGPQPVIDPFAAQSGNYMGPTDDPFANLDGSEEPPQRQLFEPIPGPGAGYAGDPFSDPFSDPFADPHGGGTYATDPYTGAPIVVDTFAPNPGQPGYIPPDPVAFPEPDPVPAQALRPVQEPLYAFNTRNPYFPGLDAAVGEGDIAGAGNIIWDRMRQRRVVDSAMRRGIGGSVGTSSPYELQQFHDVVNQRPDGFEDPLAAANRVNILIDAFQRPMVDDPSFGTFMPRLLERLNVDVSRVRGAMYENIDDGTFLELARTYVRAATTCDFFDFPRRELAGDVRMVVERASGMFYPDGSSRGGDTGGITGNLFQIMSMMRQYTRDDSWFRRDIGGLWRHLERPARYLLAIACPDMSLPLYGPRGSRELYSGDLAELERMFPRQAPRVARAGLAGSNSYPGVSGQESYGGVYVSQDVIDPLGRYMAVRFGSPGTLYGVDSHLDFGSITLMSRGAKYLVDAGGYGGEAAGAAAHGGLSLNGNYAVLDSYNHPDFPSDAIWRTNASMDYATDAAAFQDGKVWQRAVMYIKNLPGETQADYWAVLDHVNMHGDPNPQSAVVRYQMAPGIQAFRDGPGILATANMNSTGVRIFAVDAGASIQVSDSGMANGPGRVFDAAGGGTGAPSISIARQLTGDSTTSTLFYPMDHQAHRPVRIERDSDIIRGRTGAIVVDHGLERVDVIAWAPPGSELVTPTLNLQLAADLAVFRLRKGRIARIDFVNLERFQAKEPDGGQWSMRVSGPAQTLTIEPESGGGWQVYSDPANSGSATMFDVTFGPLVTRQRFSIRPGEIRVLTR